MTVMPQSREYLRRGAVMVLGSPLLFFQIVVAFSLPAFAASWLITAVPFGPLWREPVLFVLNALCIVVAPVVFMMAVTACNHGERVGLPQLLWRALPWIPRYVWTNAHTSIIFWLPMTLAITLKDAFTHAAATSATTPNGVNPLDAVAFLVVLLPLGLYLHARTLLAPYLAVHGDRPGTVATWQSWRESAVHLPLLLTTFVLACIPTAIPVIIIGAAITSGAGGRVPVPSSDALAPLVGVGLQIVRLSLVPAAYQMYLDLESLVDGAKEAESSMPDQLRPLMAGSDWAATQAERVANQAATQAERVAAQAERVAAQLPLPRQ